MKRGTRLEIRCYAQVSCWPTDSHTAVSCPPERRLGEGFLVS